MTTPWRTWPLNLRFSQTRLDGPYMLHWKTSLTSHQALISHSHYRVKAVAPLQTKVGTVYLPINSPSTWGAEAGGLQVGGQHLISKEIKFKNKRGSVCNLSFTEAELKKAEFQQ